MNYFNKIYFITIGSLSADLTLATGIPTSLAAACPGWNACIVNVTDYKTLPYFMGSISNTAEGIYYLDDFLVTSSSFLVECDASVLNFCPEPDYWAWFDDFSFESLKRFEFGLRLKFVIDDLTISAP